MLKKLQGFWQRKDVRLASRKNKKKKKDRRRRNVKGIFLFLKKDTPRQLIVFVNILFKSGIQFMEGMSVPCL